MQNVTHHYINGCFVESQGGETLDLINPTTGEAFGTVALGDSQDADSAVAAAKATFPAFSRSTRQERAKYLTALCEAILARKDEHIAARTREYGGVPLHNGFSIDGATRTFLSARAALERLPERTRVGEAEVIGRPVGVAALITPWNSALFMACNKLAPAIAAGCTVVVKSSEMSATQIHLLAECVDAAGLPPGVINIVHGTGQGVGEPLARHRDIAKISFTGSTGVGRELMRIAADRIARVTLELGGKSAHIILPDADLTKAVPFTLSVGFQNNGQVCIAGSRILVPQARKAEIEAALVAELPKWKVGRPTEPDTKLGPLVSAKQYGRVQSYIEKGIASGARLIAGGLGAPEALEGGYFVKPTIFSDVSNDMTIAATRFSGRSSASFPMPTKPRPSGSPMTAYTACRAGSAPRTRAWPGRRRQDRGRHGHGQPPLRSPERSRRARGRLQAVGHRPGIRNVWH
jgi:aldehyde dehydrogenase (NAD+)